MTYLLTLALRLTGVTYCGVYWGLSLHLIGFDDLAEWARVLSALV